MQQIFTLIIGQLNSSVFVLIILLILALIVVWRLGKWLGSQEQKSKHTDETLTKIEDKIELLPELKVKIGLIYSNTLAEDKRFTQASSPVSITKAGKEVSDKLKIEEILNRIYPSVKLKVKVDETYNAYDIQKLIFDYFSHSIEEVLTAEELNKFKREAYEKGTIVEDLYKIMAVLYRDKILKEMDKPISDIDKHDPSKEK